MLELGPLKEREKVEMSLQAIVNTLTEVTISWKRFYTSRLAVIAWNLISTFSNKLYFSFLFSHFWFLTYYSLREIISGGNISAKCARLTEQLGCLRWTRAARNTIRLLVLP